MPDQSLEQLLKVGIVRRADGREFSLEEFPPAQALSLGETVRSEEIVFRAPDGRSVTMLVNATPIRSRAGEVQSYVVTLQDLTELEDLERLRAEFLGMVSHELRTPLTSIKGSTTVLMNDASDLDPAEVRQFHRIIDDQTDHMSDLISDLLDVARIETGALPVSPEPRDMARLVDEARSRFESAGGRHTLQIDIPPDLPRVLADRRRIVQVLNNLFTNASRHSHESTAIRVAAVRDGVHVSVSVADHGRGHAGRAAAAVVPQVLAARGRGAAAGPWGHGPGPRHLQGNRGGPRRPHLGGERRARPRQPVCLHPPGRRGGRGSRRSSARPSAPGRR